MVAASALCGQYCLGTALCRPLPPGEAKEAAAMETDFLRSLHKTRQLEAEMHDALALVLKVPMSMRPARLPCTAVRR